MAVLIDLTNQFHSVHFGHVPVGQNDVDIIGQKFFKSLLSVFGRDSMVAPFFQEMTNPVQGNGVIFGNEYIQRFSSLAIAMRACFRFSISTVNFSKAFSTPLNSWFRPISSSFEAAWAVVLA